MDMEHLFYKKIRLRFDSQGRQILKIVGIATKIRENTS